MKKLLVFSICLLLGLAWFFGVAKPLFEVEAATTQNITVTAQVGSPAPSPSPSPTSTATPSPGPTDTPSPNPSSTPSPIPTPSTSPSPGVSPGPSDTPTPTPFPTDTPFPSSNPFPTPSPSTPPNILPPPGILPIIEVLKKVPPEVRSVGQVTAPIALVAILPVTTAVSAAAAFGNSGFSPDVLGKIFQALGLFPIGKPQGIVYDVETKNPVAFALLTIRSTTKDPHVEPIQETVVTDTRGIYHGLKLPIGRYMIEVRHQDYRFPTKYQRPAYLTVPDYYRGEEIMVKQRNTKEFYIIPIDPLQKDKKQQQNWRVQLKLSFWRVNRLLQFLVVPFFFLSAVILAISPSWWNLLIFGLYSALVAHKLIKILNRPILYGQVQDTQQQPLANTIVKLMTPATDEVIDVALSSAQGRYNLFAKRDKYKLSLTRTGYIWKEGNTPLSSTEVDTRQGKTQLTNTMEKVQQFTEDIFKS